MSDENPPLQEQHIQFLRLRAVADDVARERGYRSATKKSELGRLGFGPTKQLAPTLAIPVHSVRGVVESHQLRPDQPRLNDKGKARKYEMKSASKMLIDVHPRLTRPCSGDGVALIADPAVPLLITEGIPKADSAISLGLCCIAVLGVWNWRGSNAAGGKTALPDWESIALNSRPVFIVFDSDVMENRKVHYALARLKAFLESRGATVRLIYLSSGELGEKIGLDDYIAQAKATGKCDTEIRGALFSFATHELRTPAAAPFEDKKPQILIAPGRQPENIDAVERVLTANAAHLRIFQRAGEIVRVITTDRVVDSAGLRRPSGNIQLVPISTLSLLDIFERLIAFERVDRDGESKPSDCPQKLAATYLARGGGWNLPVLAGVIETPIMRPDGTILYDLGYDAATGLYFQSGEDWPAIPDAPMRAEAESALRELLEPFAEFPFVDEPARTVLVAAILTAIQRRLLESAPLFAFDAPAQRSGKSMLAESIGIIATGRKPSATGVARQDDELRKMITSALREGQAIVNLDNVTHVLDSADLARALTQSEYSDRLLGGNKMLRLPTNIFWTATGNNLTFRGDLPSRTLVSRINAGLERPEERTFRIPDLPGYLIANRKRLVAAALTILRAYHVAGRPRQNVRPWGGFDQWSRELREPLVWLGLPDPCATREQIIVNDPDRELTVEMLRTWHGAFDDKVMLAREIVAAVEDDQHNELNQALLMVAAKRDHSNQIDVRRLGIWCASKADRVIDGLRLTPDRKIRRAQGWRVSCVSQVSSKLVGEHGETRAHSDIPVGPPAEGVPASPSFDQRDINSPNSPDSPDSAQRDPVDYEDLEP